MLHMEVSDSQWRNIILYKHIMDLQEKKDISTAAEAIFPKVTVMSRYK